MSTHIFDSVVAFNAKPFWIQLFPTPVEFDLLTGGTLTVEKGVLRLQGTIPACLKSVLFFHQVTENTSYAIECSPQTHLAQSEEIAQRFLKFAANKRQSPKREGICNIQTRENDFAVIIDRAGRTLVLMFVRSERQHPPIDLILSNLKSVLKSVDFTNYPYMDWGRYYSSADLPRKERAVLRILRRMQRNRERDLDWE